MVLDSLREKKCPGKGQMGRWEGRVRSRGVLETEHGLQATEKEREGGGWTRIRRV